MNNRIVSQTEPCAKNRHTELRHSLADTFRVSAYINVEAMCGEYAPHHNTPEFNVGFSDYLYGELCDTKYGSGNVEQQSYDRGYEAGMRVMKLNRWIAQNVGRD
jgi:hypothetical protein